MCTQPLFASSVSSEIIETYWNVNGERVKCNKDGDAEIIETYWNILKWK